jgi:hypothetical protein
VPDLDQLDGKGAEVDIDDAMNEPGVKGDEETNGLQQ